MKKMIVSAWEEEKKRKKKKKKKEKKEEERDDNFKDQSQNPTKVKYIYIKQNVKKLIMMMIKIWFRYTMNNEVFK